MNTKRKCVFSTSNDPYAANCVVSLKLFKKYNQDYDMFLIGKKYTDDTKNLMDKYGIKYIEINLDKDFYKEFGYPIECYYWARAPMILSELGYSYCVYIDGDICTNKSINIDWENISGLAFAKVGLMLGNILGKDVDTIQKIWKIESNRFRENRTSSGVIFFNADNISKTLFYETIVDLYDISIKNNIPRKGDDSLLNLFYLIHKENFEFTLLDDNYNKFLFGKLKDFYLTYGENLINECFLFHMAAACPKPWSKIIEFPCYICKYFVNKWIDFLIDNFDDIDIQKYFPHIYKPIPDKINMSFYWYNYVNAGDWITPYFLKKVCGIENPVSNDPSTNNKITIISTGSIMRLCKSSTIVYGSGIRNIDQDILPGNIKCVRGPLTRKRLLEIGCECPPIYGDPAFLLKYYYNPPKKNIYKLGIIPHVSQYSKVNELYNNEKNVLVINLKSIDIESIIDQVVQCEKTVSSSLHGIIFSNTYNIPVRWIKFDNNIMGDDTKFYDHFLSIGRDNETYIDALNYKKIPVDTLIQEIEPYEIKLNVELLRDTMFFDDAGIKKSTKYLFI